MTILTPRFSEGTNGQAGPVTIAPTPPPQQLTTSVKRPLKVAIIGTAPSSNMLAPFNDPTWTIWACSPGNMGKMPRVDVWFELHCNLLWPKHQSYGAPYLEWLKQQPFPIYMQNQSMVPNALTFPMVECVKEFGQGFFTSSFAWMMAFAMRLGAVEIALYGVDMASRNEYILQRPGFYFFRNECEKRGIKVSAPHESDIMQYPPLYAYVDGTPYGRKVQARKDEIGDRLSGMKPQRDQLAHNITYLEGAQEDVDYFDSIWSGVGNDIVLLDAEVGRLNAEVARLNLLLENRAVAAPVAPSPKRGRRRSQPLPETVGPLTGSHNGQL